MAPRGARGDKRSMGPAALQPASKRARRRRARYAVGPLELMIHAGARVMTVGTYGVPPRTLIVRVAIGGIHLPVALRGWSLDRQLVESAQHGDETAFAMLIQRSGDRLHAIACHILRDNDLAADAAQQACIEMWRRLAQLRDPERFDAWAYRIVVRAAYAECRRRSVWRVVADLPDSSSLDADHGVDDRDQLERGFSRLSMDHRTVIVLKHYGGLSNAEIADVLEVSEGTVRSRLYYAMKTLRSMLEADQRLPEAVAR
jgi:RNA polymerase sigma-70 factor (ECF subfamily)